jgi:SAM-dependent methyltransferase
MNCPLCGSGASVSYHQDRHRQYFLCGSCELIFVPRSELLSEVDEKRRYEAHENSPTEDYRTYLGKIRDQILTRIQEGERGLDFGCGATTLLADLFREKGFEVDSFDKYFHPGPLVSRKYDFLILSEVIEHLRDPFRDIQVLRDLLKPRGRLFIKTKFYPSKEKFGDWFYKRDLTHVQFFNEASLTRVGKELGKMHFQELGNDLYVLGND